MADIKQTVKLNLIDTGIIDSGIRVKQGDSGITFVFIVNYAGSKIFDASNVPTIVFKRSDGISVIAECVASSGEYTYTCEGNEIASAGDLLVDLKFSWNGRESTCTARIEVVPDTISRDQSPADVYTNTVTIDDINKGVEKTKQYRDETEEFRNEAEQFTPTGYQELINDVNGMKTGKQDTLVSGQNIKTIGGQSILGNGDLDVNAKTLDGHEASYFATNSDLSELGDRLSNTVRVATYDELYDTYKTAMMPVYVSSYGGDAYLIQIYRSNSYGVQIRIPLNGSVIQIRSKDTTWSSWKSINLN